MVDDDFELLLVVVREILEMLGHVVLRPLELRMREAKWLAWASVVHPCSVTAWEEKCQNLQTHFLSLK